MRRAAFVLLLVLSSAATAEAQTRKHLSLGGGVGYNDYSDSRFNSKNLGFAPMYGLEGNRENGWGWDLKGSLGFTQVDVPAGVFGDEVRLGKVRTIPVLVGVGRSYRQGPMKVGAWVTGGPSFNDFQIDDAARATYETAGSDLEAVHVKTSLALRPGLSASYDLTSWLALQGDVSYTVNRPTVRTLVNGVSTSETWNLDHSNASLGLVLGLF